MESVLSEYKASLAELTFNSKPHINMLTILAEENVSYASDIVKIIEAQIFQVTQKQRMPVLYLLDSIVKNFGGQYMKLFTHRLVPVFMCIFEKADGKTRGDLYKLRSTWDEIFPLQLLQQLDLTVRNLDPNWPMRSKKRRHSKNPLALGLSLSPKFSEDDDKVGTYKQSEEGVEEVVEEEEIEMDEESLGVLEMLEDKLRKRQAELSRLEYLESKDKPTPTFQATAAAEEQATNESDDGLKIDLSEYPVIPMGDMKDHPSEKPQVDQPPIPEDPKPLPGSIDDDLSDTTHWLAHSSSFEPETERIHSHSFDGMTTNRVISHFEPTSAEPTPDQPNKSSRTTSPATPPPIKEEPPLDASPQPPPYVASTLVQTSPTPTTEQSTQASVLFTDQTTQYRYKRKTKNFTSQYRVPTKTIGTYFKIKSKDVGTQFDPPPSTQDTAADSTCLPLEDDVVTSPSGGQTKGGRIEHSLQILHSLRKQRTSGILCDITLSAQGKHFKAHKAVLASCSDFFHSLFASEAIKQSPLSYIELQGITASALEMVLDYLYSSEVQVDSSVCSAHEVVTAAKRLKIASLSSVCSYMEEAIASDQDLTGWVITSAGLLAPTSDRTPPIPISRLTPPKDKPPLRMSIDDRENSTSNSSSEDVPIPAKKRKSCDVSKKKKERSQSLGVAALTEKRPPTKMFVVGSSSESDDATKRSDHQCRECDETFKTRSKLNAHKLKVHTQTNRRKRTTKRKRTIDALAPDKVDESTAAKIEPVAPKPTPAPPTIPSAPQQLAHPADQSNMRLRFYQCEICEEIFSVQCFYKAHMAGHRRNGEYPLLT